MEKALLIVWVALKALAGSRKFQVAILSAVVYGVGKLGLNVSAEDLAPLVAPLWLYIFGVAIEDAGKAKATVEAETSVKLANIDAASRAVVAAVAPKAKR